MDTGRLPDQLSSEIPTAWLLDAAVVGDESPNEAGPAARVSLDTRRTNRGSATHWYLLSTLTPPWSRAFP